ncbi:MAG: ABC transporter permease [Clostridia bacterium]|nr:ABC transporter permease [Clostridia bacterium]
MVVLKKIVFFAFLVGLWEIMFRLAIWNPVMFPSPFSVWETMVQGFRDGSFPVAIGVSMKRILVGYIISILIGIPLGILVGRVKLLDETVGSIILGLQTLPSICWLPLAILWFGLSEKSIIFIVIIGALFSIALATEAGVKNVPPLYLRAASTLGARGMALYIQIILPAALPSIITGMKLGWSFAWRSLMAGELLASGLGLGYVLMMGRDLADMSQVIAVMIIIALLGLLIDRLVFARLEQGIRRRWGLA